MTHIFVLEDNLLLQGRLVEIISEFDFCTRISYSSSIIECKKHLLEGNVDVLLADLKLPDGSGRECIRLLGKINPDSISIVMSALSDGNSIIGALEDGAIGYLHKDDTSLQIIDALKMAMNGQSPMSPSIAYKVISRIQDLSRLKRFQLSLNQRGFTVGCFSDSYFSGGSDHAQPTFCRYSRPF